MAKRSIAGSREIYKHPYKKGWFKGRVYYLDLETGGRRSKNFTAQTKGEIKRAIDYFEKEHAAALSSRRRREEQPFHSKTVKEFLAEWFASIIVRKTTRELYDSTLRTHIYADEEFSAIEVGKLSALDVTTFLSNRESEGASENTRHRIYKLLHAAFQTAVEENTLLRNPIKIAKSKRPPKRKSVVVSFTAEHEATLLRYVRGKPFWHALVLLAFDSGMREAELLGLQKSQVQQNMREVQICNTLNTVGGEAVLEPVPKSVSSFRTVKVSNATMDALKRHLKANLASAGGFVFLDEQGRPWTRKRFWTAWAQLLGEAGVPHYHFHSARHTCATRLLRSGHYITAVSKRLGHKYPSITLDIYSDAIPDDQERLANAFDDTVTALA